MNLKEELTQGLGFLKEDGKEDVYIDETINLFAEYFTFQALKTYFEENEFTATADSVEKDLLRPATQIDPPEYSYTHEFKGKQVQEIRTDCFSVDFNIYGEYSEDNNTNTLDLIQIELHFVEGESFSIHSNRVKNLILEHINVEF